jgi:hypothetical protein
MYWLPERDAPKSWPRDYSKRDLNRCFLLIALVLVAAILTHSS